MHPRFISFLCEQVCKPGSVLNDHLSKRSVAVTL